MKTNLLIAAALVFPLVWGYFVERLLRRIWPPKPKSSAEGTRSQSRDDQQTFYPDYQI